MANIGNLVAKLVCDDSGFVAGMDRSLKKLEQFGGAVSSGLRNVAGNVGTILGGEIGKGVNGLLEGLKGVPSGVKEATGALALIPGYGPAIAAVADVAVDLAAKLKDVGLGGLQAVIEMGERGMGRIREQARMSRQFGMSLGNAAGLQLLGAQTGQDPLEMAAGFHRLNRSMADARGGSVEMQAAFRGLGVSMDLLRAGDSAAVLDQINRSARSNADTQQTANRVHAVFGRQAQALAPLIYGEAGALQEAAERAVRFGTAVSQADAAQVTAANRARQRMMGDWTALLQGIENRVGVALAPVWQGIAESFDKVINQAQPAFAGLRQGIDAVGFGLKSIMDGFSSGLDRWGPHLYLAMQAFEDIGRIVGLILVGSDQAQADWSQIGDLLAGNFVYSLREGARLGLQIAGNGVHFWETLRGWVQALDQVITGYKYVERAARAAYLVTQADLTGAAAAMREAITPSNLAGQMRDLSGVLLQIREAEARLNGPLPDATRLREEMEAQRHANEVAAEAARQAERGGTEGIDSDAFDRTIRGMERQYAQTYMTAAAFHDYELAVQGASAVQRQLADELFRETQRLHLELQNRTPLESFADRLAELNELFDGTEEIEGYTRAVAAAIDHLVQAANLRAPGLPGALSQGSAAAVNAVNLNEQRLERDTPEERVRMAVEQLRATAERQEQVQQRMLEELERLGFEVAF